MNISKLRSLITKLRKEPEIGELYNLYCNEHEKLIKDKTRLHINAVWRKHLEPVLAHIRADKISPLEFQELILEDLINQKLYNTAVTATRIVVTTLDFAVAISVLKANTLKTVYELPTLKLLQKQVKKNVVHRPSFDHKTLRVDLKRLIKDFKEKTNEQRLKLLYLSLALLLRPGEITKIKIDDLDEDNKQLIVTQTKTLDRFLIPLDDKIIDLIKECYEKFGNYNQGYVFRGYRYSAHISSQTLNVALKRMGYKGKLCAHGIRSIGSNFFAHHVKEVPPYVREAILQHSVGKVEKAYRRDDYYLKQRKTAMKLWYDYLHSLFED